MSHCIETMAYTGQTPWHHLGQVLPPGQSLDTWATAAGMDWEIKESPVHFCIDGGLSARPSMFGTVPEHKVLYRSDNEQPLSVVGNRYQVVQPRDVLEFYRDLTESAGYELETAGVLKGGRKFWALAKTGQSKALAGDDVVNGYLLLATSCDGTMATVATPTTIRVACNNTLALAVNGAAHAVKVGHRSKFEAEQVKRQLGLAVSQWDSFMYQMKTLSERKVKTQEVKRFFSKVFTDMDATKPITLLHQTHSGKGQSSRLVNGELRLANERAMNKAMTMFNGQGRGAELQAAKDTAWGLLCAVTEFVDHEKQSRSPENRLDSAWFGSGAALKQKALDHALQLVA